MYEDTTVTYSATASDPDNDPISWAWYYAINGGTWILHSSGSGSPSPATYTWVLNVMDSKSATANSGNLTVGVIAPPTPTLTLSSSATTITQGQSSTLQWSSTNTTSCTASNGWTGTKTTSGSQFVTPTQTTAYTLQCTGPGGSTTQSTTVTVTIPPMLSFSANPPSIPQGQSSTLSSSSTDATSCTASDGWSGTQPTSGSQSVSPMTTTAYTLTCTGPGGQTSQSTTITVTDATPPSTPTNLSATAISSSQITLSWTASTDNVGVSGYKVFRNDTQIATPTNTSYQDTGLSPNTTYTYTVAAIDGAGNTSAQSQQASATTQLVSPSQSPTPPSSACSLYTPSSAIPAGFGSPFDVVSSPSTNLMQALCDTSSVKSDLGSGAQTQYIYNTGYHTRAGGGSWTPITYASTEQLISGAWYPKTANTTISMTPGELAQDNYVLGYLCSWAGTQWKCGCRDSACPQSYWQIQSFKR